ncbi:MAG: sigma-70 family RNA polymerase sigma factor [Planctomycetota bacterium]
MTRHPASIPSAPDDLDDLRWVQALAHRLCADHALAEDLGQETWLAVRGSAASGRKRTRRWLAGVLRNRLRMARRADLRRRDHEISAGIASARQEAFDPTTPDVLEERFETHRRVSDVVSSLREPYRTTLLRRYFEGLGPREIADLDRISVGTVKTRITRGLRLVREELQQEFGHSEDARVGWFAALAPLASLHASRIESTDPGLAPDSAGRDVAGKAGALGHESVAITTAALAAAGIAVGALQLRAPSESKPSPVEVSTETARSEGPSSPNDQISRIDRRPDGPRTELLASGHRVQDHVPVHVEIDVVAMDGSPVAGLDVRRVPEDTREAPYPVGTTDAHGKIVADVAAGSARLTPDAPGWAAVLSGSILGIGAEQRATIVVAPARVVEGVVVDEQGAAVEGAIVTYRPTGDLRLHLDKPLNESSRPRWVTRSGQDGRFRFDDVPELPRPMVAVTRRGAGGASLEVPERGWVDATIRTTSDARGLQGLVLDRSGEPVRDAYVATGALAARTDRNGAFWFADPGLSNGAQPVEIRAVGAGVGFGTWSGRAVPADVEEVVVSLDVGIEDLRGRVIDPGGAPVPGLTVQIVDGTDFGVVEEPLSSTPYVWATVESLLSARTSVATTDSDGRFVLSALAGARVRLQVVDRSSLASTTTEPLDAGEKEHTLRFTPSGSTRRIHGSVRDDEGLAVAGASILALTRGAGQRRRTVTGPRAETDAQGRFELAVCADSESIELQVFAGIGFEPRTVAAVASQEPLTLRLERTAPFFLDLVGSAFEDARDFALHDAASDTPIALGQIEGTDAIGILGGEVERGRSPVYHARVGAHTLVLSSDGREVHRTTVRIEDTRDTQVLRVDR